MIDAPKVEQRSVAELIPYAANSRTHSDAQVAQIAASIKEWVLIGDYAVSKCGVIISLPHEYKNRWGGTSVRAAKILSQCNDKDGYKLTTMRRLDWTKNGQIRVHRLVAHCWIGPCPENMEVNHIDGNKANNSASNLEYVTSSENKRHAVSTGLVKMGAKHHNTKPIKLTNGNEVIIAYGCADLIKNGFRPQSIHAVANGNRKSCYGWKAEYV
jgi:hypothetical protein